MNVSNYQTWRVPSEKSWKLCDDILEQTHVLIGGATGAGKSTLLHSVIYSALAHAPVKIQFVLIDLKGGDELYRYSKLPHTIAYAEEPEQAVRALDYVIRVMNERHAILRRKNERRWQGSEIYVIIDEITVLMQEAKNPCLDQLSKIMRLGRSAGVHIICATQNPARTGSGGIPASIQQNVTSSLSLRVRSAIESRMIVGVNGAEKLPEHGRGIYWNQHGVSEVSVPKTEDDDIDGRIKFWLRQKPIRR